MMTYGSSYLCVFMFKQNRKSDGDDQSVNRKGQQIVCQSFMKISLLSTPSAEIKLPWF
jgi:hypothetical protein